MITVDIDLIKHQQAQKEAHKPVIEIILPNVIAEAEESIDDDLDDALRSKHETEKHSLSLKDALINDLDNQERDLRIERAKMSNQYHKMIADDCAQGDFAAHYARIESVSAEIREIYDRRDHVIRFGRLPEMGSAQASVNHSDILALKDLRRSLENRRHKIKAKIAKGVAKNSGRLTEWKLQIDQLDAEYMVVQSRIKELRNE